jgi:hypothetical protein
VPVSNSVSRAIGRQSCEWFPWGWAGTAKLGHAPCHDGESFGQFKAGEIGGEAVVHAAAERLDRWGAVA